MGTTVALFMFIQMEKPLIPVFDHFCKIICMLKTYFWCKFNELKHYSTGIAISHAPQEACPGLGLVCSHNYTWALQVVQRVWSENILSWGKNRESFYNCHWLRKHRENYEEQEVLSMFECSLKQRSSLSKKHTVQRRPHVSVLVQWAILWHTLGVILYQV